MPKKRKERKKHMEVALVFVAMGALVLGIGYKFQDVRAQLKPTAGLSLPPALNLADLSPTHCTHTFDAFIAAVKSRDPDAPARLWNMLTPDWRNAFIDTCGDSASIADSCLVLRMKSSFNPASNAVEAQFRRKGCSIAGEASSSSADSSDSSISSDASEASDSSAGSGSSVSSDESSSSNSSVTSGSSSAGPPTLNGSLSGIARAYRWNPVWGMRYRSSRALLSAQIAFAEGFEPIISSTIANFNSCEELEQNMGEDVTFMTTADETLQQGLTLYTRSAIYGHFIESGCLTSILQATLQTFEVVEIGFEEDSFSIPSSDTEAVITVIRRGDIHGVGSVRYATSDDTAYAGLDYEGVRGLLVFQGNERQKTFTVRTKKDLAMQGAKTVKLRLSNPTGAAELGTSEATLIIQGYVKPPSSSSSSSPASDMSSSSKKKGKHASSTSSSASASSEETSSEGI